MKPSTGGPTRSVQHSPAAPGLRAHPVHPAERPAPDTVWQNLSTTVDGISIKKTESGVFPEISSAQVQPRTARVSPKALHSIPPACCAQAASCRGAVTPAKQMLPKLFWLPLGFPAQGLRTSPRACTCRHPCGWRRRCARRQPCQPASRCGHSCKAAECS